MREQGGHKFFTTKEFRMKKVISLRPRNFVAKNAKTSGAGSHQPRKFVRQPKHKGRKHVDQTCFV